MTKKLKDVALSALKDGFNPVPVLGGDSKVPARPKHNSSLMSKAEVSDTKWENFGVSTGRVSNNLGVIDFDLKNSDEPEEVMRRFSERIGKSLKDRLVWQRTHSGGYHALYRCEVCLSSTKLARSKDGKAIIETREEGGYIKCAPSKGYKMLGKKNLSDVQVITPEERFMIFSAARMEDKLLVKDAAKRTSRRDKTFIEKFPTFNNDPQNGIDLLEEHGWTKARERDGWVDFTRPGKSFGISGGYNLEKKFFFCFTTSQDNFETERPYNNHAIYAELEFDGDYKEAYIKLNGDVEGYKTEIDEEELDDLEFEDGVDDLEFLSDEVEENTYLDQARRGEIAQGLSTGSEELDQHLRFKRNTLRFGLGLDGVGKSLFELHLACAARVLHGWKFGIIMPENRTAMNRRRLVELEFGKPISYYHDKPELWDERLARSREGFKIISNKKHYTIKDVMKMGKRLYEREGIDVLIIDPYNFFKVTGDGYGHNNEILSQLRVFVEKYCSVNVLAHPKTLRDNTDAEGFLKAPTKYDIQGGADFPYRVDDFVIMHRVVNHPDPDIYRAMQIIVEKVKEVETGGSVHRAGEYTSFKYEERDGFTGYWDSLGLNPMYEVLKSKEQIRAKEIPTMSAEEAF